MFQHLKIVVPYYIDNINAILTSPVSFIMCYLQVLAKLFIKTSLDKLTQANSNKHVNSQKDFQP